MVEGKWKWKANLCKLDSPLRWRKDNYTPEEVSENEFEEEIPVKIIYDCDGKECGKIRIPINVPRKVLFLLRLLS